MHDSLWLFATWYIVVRSCFITIQHCNWRTNLFVWLRLFSILLSRNYPPYLEAARVRHMWTKRGTIRVTMNEDISVSTPAKVECHIKTPSFIFSPNTAALQHNKLASTGTSLDMISPVTIDQVYSVPTFGHWI